MRKYSYGQKMLSLKQFKSNFEQFFPKTNFFNCKLLTFAPSISFDTLIFLKYFFVKLFLKCCLMQYTPYSILSFLDLFSHGTFQKELLVSLIPSLWRMVVLMFISQLLIVHIYTILFLNLNSLFQVRIWSSKCWKRKERVGFVGSHEFKKRCQKWMLWREREQLKALIMPNIPVICRYLWTVNSNTPLIF